ncbi:hypothetical protein DI09_71p70 [Mitosporidium daphniae]|uniref:EGF-like domain-containing protein n=1 Tax=Mitosporidium daphniae TaxID=1485682 RepID=A0A098VNR2_9MICR|nr:uncharacterized protein DI09_71p70 [Mitosporidium daphniae]KGG50404.1 hypothetical protein DI09_71p70 [Mitosporidium daphniae]|eukprot:XP_013236840.1 uncharacterized protein DI09_71p70 [Mitosporidium daphniae]
MQNIIRPDNRYDPDKSFASAGGDGNIYDGWNLDLFYHLHSLPRSGKQYAIGLLEKAKCAPAGTPMPVLHYLRSVFSDELRPAVCGDGALEQLGDGARSAMGGPYAPMLTPPMNYDCPYGEKVGCWRECRWGPLVASACNSGMETRNVFLHYCGNGIVELTAPHAGLSHGYGRRYTSLMPHALICGYEDPFMTVPIFCNWGHTHPGHYYFFMEGTSEQCDLGSEMNGKPGSGCTKDCKLHCVHGNPNYEKWPELPCIQPCLKPGFEGFYCDKPRCQNGVVNWEDGTCISCDSRQYSLPYCEGSEFICGGHGKILPNGHGCKCDPGWMGSKCERSTCMQWPMMWEQQGGDIDPRWCAQCEPGWGGPYCLQSTCQHGVPSPTNDGCICYHEIFGGNLCQETGCIQPVLLGKDDTIIPITEPLNGGKDAYLSAACYGTLCMPGRTGEHCSVQIEATGEELQYKRARPTSCNEQAGETDTASKDGICIDPCWRDPLFFGKDCFESNGLFMDVGELDDDDQSMSIVSEGQIWAQACKRGWTGPICQRSRCPVSADTSEIGCKGRCPPGFLGNFCEIPMCVTPEKKDSPLLSAHDEDDHLTSSSSWWSGIKTLFNKDVSACTDGCNADALPLMTLEELGKWCGSSLAASCSINSIGATTKDGCKACRKGFFGSWCNMQAYVDGANPGSSDCLFPYWGTFCTLISPHCEKQHTAEIDRFTGKCICKYGWRGSECSEPICANGMLDTATGYCLQCKQGWKGAACDVPLCQFGFICRSDGMRIDHFSENGALLPFPPKLVAVESSNGCSYESDYLNKNLLKMWRLLSGSTDNFIIRAPQDGRCSACYHQPETQSHQKNLGEPLLDNKNQVFNPYCELDADDLPCYHGLWDPHLKLCGPCFPGFWGPLCNESFCEHWDILYIKCAKCTTLKRFGLLCQWVSRCEWGIPDLDSGSGACLEGTPCRREDAYGPFCQLEASSSSETDEASPLHSLKKNFQNRELGICKAGWRGPYCWDLACEHGLPNMMHPLLYCYEETCIAGWTGPYCDQPLIVQPNQVLFQSSLPDPDKIPSQVLETAHWIEALLMDLRAGTASLFPDSGGNNIVYHSTGRKERLAAPISPNALVKGWLSIEAKVSKEDSQCLHPAMARAPGCDFSLCSTRGGVPLTLAQLALAQSQGNGVLDPEPGVGCQCRPGFKGPYCEKWTCAHILKKVSDMSSSGNLIPRYFPENRDELVQALLAIGESATLSANALDLIQNVDSLLQALVSRIRFLSMDVVLEGEKLKPLIEASSTSWLSWRKVASDGRSLLESFLEALKLEAGEAHSASSALLQHRMASLERRAEDILPVGFMHLLRVLVFSQRDQKTDRFVFKLTEYHLTKVLFEAIPEAQRRIFPIDNYNHWKKSLEETLPRSEIILPTSFSPLRCLPGGIRVQRISGAKDLFMVTESVVEPEGVKRKVQQNHLAIIRRILQRKELLDLNPNFSDALLVPSENDFGQCSFCWKSRVTQEPDDIRKGILEVVHGNPELPFCKETIEGPLMKSSEKSVVDSFRRMGVQVPEEMACPPGFYGTGCQRTWCLEWDPDSSRCRRCSPGHHGHLCQWKSNCIHGDLDLESEQGLCKVDQALNRPRCNPPYYFGRFCNETRCIIPALGIQDGCSHGCLPGWQTLPVPNTGLGNYCDIPICVHGIPDLEHGYCKEGSCNPSFWGGQACDKPRKWCPASNTTQITDTFGVEVQLKPPWRPGYATIIASHTCGQCPPGWTGDLCNLPLCIHGSPDLENGGCYRCHDGWLKSLTCEEMACKNGIFNPKALIEGGSSKPSQWLWREFSSKEEPLCLACLGDWSGPDCSTPGCNPVTEMDPLTQKCLQCPLGRYGPKCTRIARCIHGILDENSLDGSCLSGSCRIGQGRFCDSSVCQHGQTDPRTLFCAYCYDGWISSDLSRPRCDIANCKNGRMLQKSYSIHAFECICMPGFEGPACDLKEKNSGADHNLTALCPLPKCDPIPILDCFAARKKSGENETTLNVEANGTREFLGLEPTAQIMVRERKCVKPPEGFPKSGTTASIIRILNWVKNFSSESSMGIRFKGDDPHDVQGNHNFLIFVIIVLLVVIAVLIIYIFIYLHRWRRIYKLALWIVRRLFCCFRRRSRRNGNAKDEDEDKEKEKEKMPIPHPNIKPRRNSISTPYRLEKRRFHID